MNYMTKAEALKAGVTAIANPLIGLDGSELRATATGRIAIFNGKKDPSQSFGLIEAQVEGGTVLCSGTFDYAVANRSLVLLVGKDKDGVERASVLREKSIEAAPITKGKKEKAAA